MSKEIREQITKDRILQLRGKRAYKNKSTGKKWYYMGDSKSYGRSVWYLVSLRDEAGKNMTISVDKFEQFYERV